VAAGGGGKEVILYIYQKIIFKMKKKYKWGILAPGNISGKFSQGLKLLDNAELYAVGSRDLSRAEKFARTHGFQKYYGSYEELAADEKVDIVYIASPHSHHYEHTMLCLRNKKAVICEKAFALNSHEVEAMISEASKQNVFLMEAIWPPFQPAYKKINEILGTGKLGKLLHIDAQFTFRAPYDPNDRKFNLSLGGGSLLDIGIYPVIDALNYMGLPDEIMAKASFAPSGSDESISIIFGYGDGRMATLYSSFGIDAGTGCGFLCERGNLYFSREFDKSQLLRVELAGKEIDRYSVLPPAEGYQYEAIEVMKCMDEGKLQSNVVSHRFSLDLINTLDRIRKVAGIKYPGRD
jgi:predicted dehydrogenase